jgi:hypothetical protein
MEHSGITSGYPTLYLMLEVPVIGKLSEAIKCKPRNRETKSGENKNLAA